jgi:hypothetical protein
MTTIPPGRTVSRWGNVCERDRIHYGIRSPRQAMKKLTPDLPTAGIMFYDGPSCHDPKVDAPPLADVHSQRGKVLEVGIGRPRVIWVVYPWKGNDVLCRGAVLPYHEFASADRLTDKEWVKLLDSSNAPEQPEWVQEWTVPKK